MNGSLRKISAHEFARRLKSIVEESDKRFAFFLGAGCSVSSGIPAAASLVKDHWLPKLRELRAPDRRDLHTWAKVEFPEYDRENAALLYGATMKELFLSAEDRQRELERLCDGRFPGFGYAVLASLMCAAGGCFSVALTTNFDDLIPDALYLYTEARPLVIHHESLFGFIRPTRTRPLVVKLHGDHRLSPRNTQIETARLKEEVESKVRALLLDRGLVFLGYGGNDVGIAGMFEGLSDGALPLGVFCVGAGEPENRITPWLEKRKAVWVQSSDFDELMLVVRDTFNLCHPDDKRFSRVFEKYTKTYESLSGRILATDKRTSEALELMQAVKRTDKSFPGWWAVELEARRFRRSAPDEADAIYREGLDQFPSSPELLDTYALFLKNVRKDYDRAEEFYKRAIEADPNHANSLGNYAVFLDDVREHRDEAEKFYRRALEADPSHANNLGNYAVFLDDVRKDYERAEEFYKRALQADPNHATNLGNYAVFLKNVRNDYDRAEEFCKRALEADPNHANNLGNYAGFLLARGRQEEGMDFLDRAFSRLDGNEPSALPLELWFYMFAHGPDDKRGEALGNVKKLLTDAIRSTGWDLSANVQRAKEQDHPDAEWLGKLAAVIAGEADIKTLDRWAKWGDA